MEYTIEEKLSFATLYIRILPIGEDYQILAYGGDKPHIGCTVLAVPRPSLSGDGSVSVTSSVLNLVSHKDEAICRYLAETYAQKKNATVVCSGGFHVDHITQENLSELMDVLHHICL